DVPHLGQPQPQLRQPPDPRQHDRVPQRVVPVAVAQPLRLRQQPEMVVVPHGPRGHTDGRGEFSEPHAPSRNDDAAARSTGHRRTAHGGSSSTWTPPTSSGPLIRGGARWGTRGTYGSRHAGPGPGSAGAGRRSTCSPPASTGTSTPRTRTTSTR